MSTLNVDTIQDKGAAFEHARLVQVVNTVTGTSATGTTAMPNDNTIPQNTEGDQYMTLAITPTHASNKLLIEVHIIMACATSGRNLQAALFKDSTAGALASTFSYAHQAGEVHSNSIVHYMTTGGTSEITFKVRAGVDSSGTVTFNGYGGNQVHGGVASSAITISEIRV